MKPFFGYLLVVLIGYLLGSSNLAYYISRYRKIDIRKAGSGNLGASNAMILMGWKMGILVALHDIGKAILAAWLCGRLFPDLALSREVAGTACILGHLFPFYLGFRGGKGFASTVGVIAALNLRYALILAAVIVLLVLITDYMVVGTVSTVVSYPVYCLFTRQFTAAALLTVTALIILYKHRENFVRILNGTEIGLRRAHRGELRIDREKDGGGD